MNNEYKPFEGYNEEEHGVPDLENLDLTKVVRQIVADKPRVTRFPIKWGSDVSSSSEVEEDNHVDNDDQMMEEVEGDENKDSGNAFLSPFKSENDSSSNIVSPDASCFNDVIMGM